MTDSGPNPENRSNAALYTLMAGFALMALAWVFGANAALWGAMMSAVSGGGFAAIASLYGAALCMIFGLLLTLIGGVWILIQVTGQQLKPDRYDKVDR